MGVLFRELVTNTLRTSFMAVAVFLLSYVVLALLSDQVDPPSGIVAYSSILLFGLLLSAPFSFPLVFASVTFRIASDRYLSAFLRSSSARVAIGVILIILLGLLQTYLWVSVQGLGETLSELRIALYVAGGAAGGTAALFGIQKRVEVAHD